MFDPQVDEHVRVTKGEHSGKFGYIDKVIEENFKCHRDVYIQLNGVYAMIPCTSLERVFDQSSEDVELLLDDDWGLDLSLFDDDFNEQETDYNEGVM